MLVLDDTDRWLTATWLPDSRQTRAAFFTTIPRLLSEELDAAAVIAVHPTYLDDDAYRAARGFLSRTIAVPAVPSAGAVAAILHRRIALAMDARGLPAVEVERRAGRRRAGHRARLLLRAGRPTSGETCCWSCTRRSPWRSTTRMRERIERGHIELAIAEGEG